MKKLTIILFVLGFAFASFKTIEAVTYKAVVAESELTWEGTRPGKTHNGTVGIKEGSLIFEDGKLTAGDFTLDMTKIVVLDIKLVEADVTVSVGYLNDAVVTFNGDGVVIFNVLLVTFNLAIAAFVVDDDGFSTVLNFNISVSLTYLLSQ